MTAITPEAFMAQPSDPDEDTLDGEFVDVVLTRGPGPDSDFVELEDPAGRGLGPESGAEWVDRGDGFAVLRITRQSIAESLRQLVGHFEGNSPAAQASDSLREAYEDLRDECQVLEALHDAKQTLIDQVLADCSKSTSKLANKIRAVLEPVVVPEPALVDPQPAEPSPDADVEVWRAFARGRGYTGPDVDKANRSQIRTMLGIAQPVAEGAQS